MVTNDTLLVSNNVIIPHDRLDALLHHEIGTHILTWYNGGHQPLKQLQTGLAHYDELQEGLGVLAEYLSGNLSAIRLRTLAARVVAVRLVTNGARFKDIFDTLRNDYRFTERAAFSITARVLRGGGLTKDVVYLRGLKGVLGYLPEGYPFRLLLAGKFSLAQLPAIRKLDSMGRLEPPAILPAYLHNAASQRRLDECTDIPLDRLYIVGDKLMEVNVFSPGGVGVAQDLTGANFIDYIIRDLERKVMARSYYGPRLGNVQLATL